MNQLYTRLVCSIYFLSVLLLPNFMFAQVDCDSPDANTPYITRIDTKVSQEPQYCYSTGTISLVVAAVGGVAGNPSEWEFRMEGGSWRSNYSTGRVSFEVSAGTYSNIKFYARNKVTGCTTSYDSGTIDFRHKFSGGEPIINGVEVYDASFCDNNGRFRVYATNPNGSFSDMEYSLNGGSWQSDESFQDLAPGTYTIRVASSDRSCITTTQRTIDRKSEPNISILGVNATSSNTCTGVPNGRIEIDARPDYLDYSIDDGNTFQGSPVFENLEPGTYRVVVRENDGWCIATERYPFSTVIAGNSEINFGNTTTTPASDCESNNGSITINAYGSATLNYRLENGQWQSSKTISGLSPGYYNVFVRYGNGTCETPHPENPIAVGPIGDLQINNVTTTSPSNCNPTQGNGVITIEAENGGAPILYSINGGMSYTSNNQFTGLSTGAYEVQVANGDQSCPIAYGVVELLPPQGLSIQNVQVNSPSDCLIADGSMTINVSPAGNYEYSIDGGQSFQTDPTFSNVKQGNYYVVVRTLDGSCSISYSDNPVYVEGQTCPEICNDGIDNDGDGQIDNCAESNCGLMPVTVTTAQPNCPTGTPTGSIIVNTSRAEKDCSTLEPGDIVIFGASSFGFTAGFDFMPFVDIPGGTQIYFTDKNWNGNSFSDNEGLIQWTAPPAGVSAGTEVRISRFFFSWSTNVGAILMDGDIPGYSPTDLGFGNYAEFDLEYSYGDNIIALCIESFSPQQFSFLYSFEYRDDSYPISSTPPGLVAGETYVVYDNDNGGTLPVPALEPILYSADGGMTYQENGTFSDLAPGAYNVLIKKGDCLTAYPGNPVRINACEEICGNGLDDNGNGQADCADSACGVPSFTVSSTAPACPPQATTGSITITPSGSFAYQFSIDNGNTWRSNPNFTNLESGAYNVMVKRIDTDCTRAYANNPIIFPEPSCAEICDDGYDNDGDGLVDCDDPDCGVSLDGINVSASDPTCPAGRDDGAIQISAPVSTEPVYKNESNLSPGDIAITFYDASPDQFTFVPTVNIAGGTKILFTDKGYETTPPDMRNAEGIAQWTAPSGGILAGTAVVITRVPDISASQGTILFDEAIPGYGAYDNSNPNFTMKSAGDQLIALVGSSLDVAEITFLFAIHANGNSWDADATGEHSSALPPGLVEGETAFAVGDVGEANLPIPTIDPPVPTSSFEYSIDGGNTFQTDTAFTNLAAGTYELLIRDQSTGCTAVYTSETIMLEAPDCPEICDDDIDNDGDGDIDCADSDCGVPSYGVEITQQIGCPPNPTTGTITITPYGALNYEFSVDNGATWTTNPVFANLTAGSYDIIVKNMDSGCTLNYTGNPIMLQSPFCQEICDDGVDNDSDGLVDCDDPDCNVPTIEGFATIPTTYCYSSDGSIIVEALTVGGNVGFPTEWEYSKDDGATWQDSNTFTGLAQSSYTIKVRNKLSGCNDGNAGMVVTIEANPVNLVEICDNGIDDDCDGLIDCADPDADCYVAPYEVAVTQTLVVGNPFAGKIEVIPSDPKVYQYSIDNDVTRKARAVFDSLAAGTYNVVVSTDHCSKPYENNPVILHEVPNGTIANSGPVCEGENVFLSFTATAGDTPYSIIVDGLNGNNPITNLPGNGAPFWTLTPANLFVGDQTFTLLSITDVNGMTVDLNQATTITVNALPTIAITATAPSICPGETITLDAGTGFASYLWSTGETTQSIDIQSADTYTVTVTNAAGCSSEATPEIIANTVCPEICDDGIDNDGDGMIDTEDSDCDCPGVAGLDKEICPGECVQIGCDEENLELCYVWEVVGDPNAAPIHGANPEVCPTETTTYKLYITDDQGNIIEEDEVTVIVPLTLTFSPLYPSVCPGESVAIEAVPSGGTNYTFLWETGETTPVITVTPEETSFYTVEVTDTETGCTITGEAQVNVLYPPSISIVASSSTICQQAPVGIKDDGAILKNLNETCPNSTILYAGTGLPGYSYLWSNGETTPMITVTEPGLYTVTVTKDGGCSSIASYELESCIQVDIEPAIVQTGQGLESVLDAGAGYASYIWSDGSTGQTIPVTGAGTYGVTVVDNNGCMAIDDFIVGESVVDPSDLYLVFSAIGNDNHDVYICSSNESELTEEEKAEIESKIIPVLQKDTSLVPNVIWDCSPIIDPDLYHTKQFYPMVIEDLGSGLFWSYGGYNPATLNYDKIYRFNLESGGVSLSSITDLRTNRRFPLSDFSFLPGTVTAGLFVPDENNIYPSSPNATVTMYIQFQSTQQSEPTENPYVLCYNEQEITDIIIVEEMTNMNFQIKKRGEGGILEEIDMNNIQSIIWKIDGGIGYRFANNKDITYRSPQYNIDDSEISIEPTIIEISGMSFDLSAIIQVIPRPLNPGYNTLTLDNSDIECKGGDPMDYIQYALNSLENNSKKVKDDDDDDDNDPTISDIYNGIIQGREINILLATSENNGCNASDTEGTLFGCADIDFDISNGRRFQIDSDKVMKGDGKYSNCPVDAQLELVISNDELQSLIVAIENHNIDAVLPLINRIVEAYPEINENNAFLNLFSEEGNPSKSTDELLNYHYNNQLAYYASPQELEQLIQFSNRGTINLIIDNLCDITTYSNKICPEFGSSINLNTGENTLDLIREWYQNLSASEVEGSQNHQVHNIRNAKYTETLIHELAHIQYRLENKIEYFKWYLIRKEFKDLFNMDDCYPARKGDSSYCSREGGHEYKNPDNTFTCNIVNSAKYTIPCVRTKK